MLPSSPSLEKEPESALLKASRMCAMHHVHRKSDIAGSFDTFVARAMPVFQIHSLPMSKGPLVHSKQGAFVFLPFIETLFIDFYFY